VPLPGANARSTFLKLGARRYLVIAIVSVAAVIEPAEDGTVGRARIAVGACSEAPRRLDALEAELVGRPFAPGIGDVVAAAHLDGLSPIDDVRGSAAYRDDAAATIVARALDRLAEAG
jgi:CO/xanthine dehydrogenase FAD-binding subunit